MCAGEVGGTLQVRGELGHVSWWSGAGQVQGGSHQHQNRLHHRWGEYLVRLADLSAEQVQGGPHQHQDRLRIDERWVAVGVYTTICGSVVLWCCGCWTVLCGVQVVYAEQEELEVSRWCMLNCGVWCAGGVCWTVVCGVQVVYAEQVELEVSTTKGAAGQRIPQAGQAHSSVLCRTVLSNVNAEIKTRGWFFWLLGHIFTAYNKYGTKYRTVSCRSRNRKWLALEFIN